MNYLQRSIVFSEVPGHISLCYSITGCPVKCKGCHSFELWNPENGVHLSRESFEADLKQYKGLVSCILFFGGEWHLLELLKFLRLSKQEGYKTCLYTGLELDQVSEVILSELDYIKVGPYISELGGLENKNTNQRFLDLNMKKDLTSNFSK